MENKFATLHKIAEEHAAVFQHQIEWGSQTDRFSFGACKLCRYPVSVDNRPSKHSPPFNGLALTAHCPGQILTFAEAEAFFKDLPPTGSSVPLGNDLRLVRLSPDRFGIQYKNTYIVRVCDNGTFILNSSGKMNQQIADIINNYTPADLRFHKTPEGKFDGFYYHGGRTADARFNDMDTVDMTGTVLPRVVPTHKVVG